MSGNDFDVESLAAYLHLVPQQITRLAERGKLPARKVGGAWRFSRAEVHHWLESRIGALDDDELVEMEGVLQRASPPHELNPSIAQMLPPEAIAVPLAAKTRESVIKGMTELAANTGLLWDPVKMADAVRIREQMQPTALDNGVALLHPRRPLPNILAEPFLALGCTVQGIPFGGARGTLTDIFFLICSTDDRGHLRVLARVSRLLGDTEFLSAIRGAADAATVRDVIVAKENELTD